MASYFNAEYYFAAKAKQLSTTEKTWTAAEVQAEFANQGINAEDHYKAYGASEGLSPNAYFNEKEYLASKLAALQDTDPTWANKTVADLQAEFKALGINAADHYEQYGAFETRKDGTLLNPSNAFDANAYFAAKLAQLQKINFEGADTMTVADVVKAVQEAGISPVAHLQAYGAAEAKTDGIPLVQTVPVAQRVPNDPIRAEFGELVPSNFNPPSKAPAAAVAAPVTKPADVGGLSATKPVIPTAPVKVPGDAGYIAPPANLVDTNEKPVLPPTTTEGTGPNAGFIIVDKETGKGTVVKPDGTIQGEVVVEVKPDGTVTPPAPNAPVEDKDGNNTNDKPADNTGKPVEPTPPTVDPEPENPDVGPTPPAPFSADITTAEAVSTLNLKNNVTSALKVTVDSSKHIAVELDGAAYTVSGSDTTAIDVIDATSVTGKAASILSKDNAALVALTIKGQTSSDLSTGVTGGTGVDTLILSSGNVKVNASTGNDVITVAGGNATLALGSGAGKDVVPGYAVNGFAKVTAEGIHGAYAGNAALTITDIADLTTGVSGSTFSQAAASGGSTTLLGTGNSDKIGVQYSKDTLDWEMNTNTSDNTAARKTKLDAAKTQAMKLKVDGGDGTNDMLYADVHGEMLSAGTGNTANVLTLNAASWFVEQYLTKNVSNVENLWINTFGTSDKTIDVKMDDLRTALKLGADKTLTLNYGEEGTITGSAVADKIINHGDNAVTIKAGEGNDIVLGDGETNANFYSGNGTETAGKLTIEGGNGADTLRGGKVGDIIHLGVKPASGVGNEADTGTATERLTYVTDAQFNTAIDATTANHGRGGKDFLNGVNGWLGDDEIFGSAGADLFEYHTHVKQVFNVSEGQGYAATSFKALGTDTIHNFELGKDLLLINMVELADGGKIPANAADQSTSGTGHGITRGTAGAFADILLASDIDTISTSTISGSGGEVGVQVTKYTLPVGVSGDSNSGNDFTIKFTFGDTTDTLTINLVDVQNMTDVTTVGGLLQGLLVDAIGTPTGHDTALPS